jgi:capsular polysaccharide biosynthesis protein
MAEQAPQSDLTGLILKRWWVLLLGVVLGAGLGVLALRVVPPTYTATATQLIKGVPGSGTGAPYLAAQFAVARAKSYPAFIYSATVLDSVRSDLGPDFTDARLREQLSANNPTDTPLVQVTATGSTAKEAQDLANSASRHLARFITQIETVSGSTPVIVETAVQAGLPSTPWAPQPTLFLALGVTGGFALGVVAVLAWGALEARRRRSVAANSAVGDSVVDEPVVEDPSSDADDVTVQESAANPDSPHADQDDSQVDGSESLAPAATIGSAEPARAEADGTEIEGGQQPAAETSASKAPAQ